MARKSDGSGGAMAGKNRSHGKIDRFPEELKKNVNDLLLKGKTYAEISEYLRRMGRPVHQSSVWRYGSDYLRRFEKVRMARDYARHVAEDNLDRPTTELHEANNALISQIIMEMLIAEDTDLDAKVKAAKAVAELQGAQVRNEKLKIEARKASGEIHAAMNVLRTKVFEKIGNGHPEVAEIIMQIADEVENENSAD